MFSFFFLFYFLLCLLQIHFFTPRATLWQPRPPCACLHFRVAFASLWCIRWLPACCLRLNCKTWPFKNAPRLPKLCQCLELCRGQNSQGKKKQLQNQKTSWQRWKEQQRCCCGKAKIEHCGCGQSYATGALQNLWKLIFLNGKPKRQLNAKRSICEWGHEFYWHFHLKRVSGWNVTRGQTNNRVQQGRESFKYNLRTIILREFFKIIRKSEVVFMKVNKKWIIVWKLRIMLIHADQIGKIYMTFFLSSLVFNILKLLKIYRIKTMNNWTWLKTYMIYTFIY